MTDKAHKLTAARLRKLLHYDRDTGTFTWLPRRSSEKWNERFAGKPAGTLTATGYLQIKIDYEAHGAHRLAWLYCYGRWPRGHIDHRNGIPSDNRLSNLRVASPAENNANKGPLVSNRSGVKGVHWVPQRRKWHAAIQVNRKVLFLGRFDLIEDAEAAYLAAAEKHFGDFAHHAAAHRRKAGDE